MTNDRDMYYNTYGYSSAFPNPMMNNQNMPNTAMPYMNLNNELENRKVLLNNKIIYC